jgi:hypothetical protein
MNLDSSTTLVSAIVPVGARQSPAAELFAEYKAG